MPPTAATQAAARLWTVRPELHTNSPHLPRSRDNLVLATKLAEFMIPPAGSVNAVHMRACTGIKKRP